MSDDIKQSLSRLDESLSYLVIPYVITSLSMSTIADVFPYEPADLLIPNGFKSLNQEDTE